VPLLHTLSADLLSQAATDEVRYDLQVLADGIESYWTHLQGVGTLENSLWGYDGKRLRVWLDALTIEETKVDSAKDAYETVQESVSLSLDFYPLCECFTLFNLDIDQTPFIPHLCPHPLEAI
jgi:hypothetical protein